MCKEFVEFNKMIKSPFFEKMAEYFNRHLKGRYRNGK